MNANLQKHFWAEQFSNQILSNRQYGFWSVDPNNSNTGNYHVTKLTDISVARRSRNVRAVAHRQLHNVDQVWIVQPLHGNLNTSMPNADNFVMNFPKPFWDQTNGTCFVCMYGMCVCVMISSVSKINSNVRWSTKRFEHFELSSNATESEFSALCLFISLAC